jgi:regulator of nucleoside diphosphate kinase
MQERTIYITEYDRSRLLALVQEARQTEPRGNEYLDNLEAELSRGRVVVPAEVPPDVVTMNSKVRLSDVETGEEMIYTLVFPSEADIGQGKISVLAPVGTAMLGYRAGDTFFWNVPDGVCQLRVEEVLYQPEAAGHYHL